MDLTLTPDKLVSYVARQIENTFPDAEITPEPLRAYIGKSLERLEYCFSHIKAKYFNDGNQTFFSHLHSDQYAMFLYYLSNTIWQMDGDKMLASKIYYLNKNLHALDIFYEVELPEIFLLSHCVGTVFGRAKYSNYLFVSQNCTIGGNLAYEYPVIDEGVALYVGSKVIGRSHINSHCVISAGTLVMDSDVPASRVVFGIHPNIQFKPAKRKLIDFYFR
jgi:serine O-acetyltransferase